MPTGQNVKDLLNKLTEANLQQLDEQKQEASNKGKIYFVVLM